MISFFYLKILLTVKVNLLFYELDKTKSYIFNLHNNNKGINSNEYVEIIIYLDKIFLESKLYVSTFSIYQSNSIFDHEKLSI